MTTEPSFAASIELAYIPDHRERARKRLLSQDWDKPRIASLAEALGMGAQALEDVYFDLLMGRRLESSVGAQLDTWGAIVGEARGALGDTDYRRFIEARVAANVCKGSVDELLAIWELVTYPSTVRYLSMYPAGFKLQAVRPRLFNARMARRVSRFRADVKPAGVTMVLIEALPGYFGFDGNPAALGYNVGKFARVL